LGNNFCAVPLKRTSRPPRDGNIRKGKTNNLCSGAQRHAHPQRARGKTLPAIERAKDVIKVLYSNGVPDQATERNASLCRRVGAKF